MIVSCWCLSLPLNEVIKDIHALLIVVILILTKLYLHLLIPHLQVQICNARAEETALAVYWVMDGVDKCCIGFALQHLVKDGDKFDSALA